MAGNENELIGAVRFGSQADVRRLLSHGHEVNAADPLGMTPLHWSVFHGKTEVAELLVRRGANISARDASGEAPIHYAAARSTAELAKLLIARGANANVVNAIGQSPLHFAATWSRDIETPAFLIANGANVNAVDNDGKTPLDTAEDRLSDELAELLKRHGGLRSSELASPPFSQGVRASRRSNG